MSGEIKVILNSADEAQVLLNLLNIAVKAVGLEGAESCAIFARRISEAAKAAQNGLGDVSPVALPPSIDGVGPDKAVIN